MKFKLYRQLDTTDCGAACLKMVFDYYKREVPISEIKSSLNLTKLGTNTKDLIKASNKYGFKSKSLLFSVEELKNNFIGPTILLWNDNHFVVLYKIKGDKFYIADPGNFKVKLDYDSFKKQWYASKEKGLLLLLVPNIDNAQYKLKSEFKKENSLLPLFSSLKTYKRQLLIVFLALIVSNILNMAFPFITKLIIDNGIGLGDMSLITSLLIFQFTLFVGGFIGGLVRSYFMTYIGASINVNIVSAFLEKLLKLKLSFFENKVRGDLLQRISDHSSIEEFVSESSISAVYSFFTLFTFTVALSFISPFVVAVFFGFLTLELIWLYLFKEQTKSIWLSKLIYTAENNEHLIEVIDGVSEIKSNRLFKSRIKEKWADLQSKIFKNNLKKLSLEYYKNIGISSLEQFKNILITFICAVQIINGNLTIGSLLAISFVIGQLNGPANNIIEYINRLFDIKVPLARISDVTNTKDELVAYDEETKEKKELPSVINNIHIQDVSFGYNNEINCLNDLCFTIPRGSVTAVVGSSGSGKTTLMKLLQGHYSPNKGSILLDKTDLNSINPEQWRDQLSIVNQEGYIFSDTIEYNIAMSKDKIDSEKVRKVLEDVNLLDLVDSFPMKEKTKVGNSGRGLSVGQRQRLLIARSLYKQTKFLLLDEATSAIDTVNEKNIVNNIMKYHKDCTLFVIAHRLSTVRNADQIIVLENGRIKEQGNHSSLVNKGGTYFELVKDQLELQVA